MKQEAKAATISKAVSEFRHRQPFPSKEEVELEASRLFVESDDQASFMEAWRTEQVAKLAAINEAVTEVRQRDPFPTDEEAENEASRRFVETADRAAFMEVWRKNRSSARRVAQAQAESRMIEMLKGRRKYD